MNMTNNNPYLELECNGYFIRKKFEEFIKETNLYIVEDCYKLILDNGFLNKHHIADLFFKDERIDVKTDECYFEFVRKIFDDFSRKYKIKSVIRIQEDYY